MKCEIGDSVILSSEREKKSKCPTEKNAKSRDRRKNASVENGVFENFLQCEK